jgi:hypothetical protein
MGVFKENMTMIRIYSILYYSKVGAGLQRGATVKADQYSDDHV